MTNANGVLQKAKDHTDPADSASSLLKYQRQVRDELPFPTDTGTTIDYRREGFPADTQGLSSPRYTYTQWFQAELL